jgi:hypothetical protein
MITKQKKKIILSALRSATQILEEELEETPAPPKRENKIRQHFQNQYEYGVRQKPSFIKNTK